MIVNPLLKFLQFLNQKITFLDNHVILLGRKLAQISTCKLGLKRKFAQQIRSGT